MPRKTYRLQGAQTILKHKRKAKRKKAREKKSFSIVPTGLCNGALLRTTSVLFLALYVQNETDVDTSQKITT